jgi:hypothetical protein
VQNSLASLAFVHHTTPTIVPSTCTDKHRGVREQVTLKTV